MRNFFCLIISLFFLPVVQEVRAQVASDTAVSHLIDSVQVNTDDAGENENDVITEPIPDSLIVSVDSVRSVPARQVSAYTKNPDYSYANDSSLVRKEVKQTPGIVDLIFSSAKFWFILLITVIILVLFGIYKLARENSFGWLARKSKYSPIGSEEQKPEPELDPDEAIKKFQHEGNYRMAIRYMYIRLIRTLHNRNIVSFRESSTNAEILQAMRSHRQAGDFKFAMIAYEHIFYGGLNPNQELFQKIKIRFDTLQNVLAG